MAYSRTKTDIRTMTIPTSLVIQAEATQMNANTKTITHPNMKREFAKVMLCTLPLVGILVIATYLDTTDSWVTTFAEKVLNLGK